MIRRVKGTRDILPPESRVWNAVEAIAHRTLGGFGYHEIRLPALEPTELFVRGVGEGTDIVAKEMYTFPDRKGRSLTLRPEGTAGVARAFIENGLGQWPQPVRLAYLGPMWRYEKMQRGRYRQFAQIGIEILGAATAHADVEVLLALHSFLDALGFHDLVIVLNNLGDPEDRVHFVDQLKQQLAAERTRLCHDCLRRWDENPLRILDCKVPSCRELAAGVTPIAEVASQASREHVEQVMASLQELGVAVRFAPRLVRGLDYYLRTVFEVISPALGEDTVICGGGRYDRLISDLGGPSVPGVGFAIGEDRLIEILPEDFRRQALQRPVVAILPLGAELSTAALGLARTLVAAGIEVRTEVTERSLKAGLKWAAKLHARAALIVGHDELLKRSVVLRDLVAGEQQVVAMEELVDALNELFAREETPR